MYSKVMRTNRHTTLVAAVMLAVPIALLCAAVPASAEVPHRGAYVSAVPRGAVTVRYHGAPYYYHDGGWYRPWGNRFVVVAPPLGVVVPVLPGVYSTFWFGGVPYYFANDVYYSWRPDLGGYVVTQPPPGAVAGAQGPAGPEGQGAGGSEPFIYPMKGQSEQQQATDRYECHRWAADQTKYDPTQSAPSAPGDRDGYFRAMAACLTGRGYSVK